MMEKELGSRKVFSFCFLFSLCLHGAALFFLENFYSFRVTPYSYDKSFVAQEKMAIPPRREDSPILRFTLHQPTSHLGMKESVTIPAASLQKETEDFGMIHQPSSLCNSGGGDFIPLHFSSRHTEQRKVLACAKTLVFQKKDKGQTIAWIAKAQLKKASLVKAETKTPSSQEEFTAKAEPKISESCLQEEFLPKKEQQTDFFPSTSFVERKRVPLSSELTPFHSRSSLLVSKRAAVVENKKKPTFFNRKSPLSFRMPSSSDLHILSCSNDFDLDVVYNIREDAEGYLFALTLIPKKSLAFQKIKQNYLFLLDRSHSIGEERFFSMKAALSYALSLLDKEDTFNIIAFDKQSESLFEKNMPVNSATIRHAKEFLEKQRIAGMFSSTRISGPLFLGWQQLMKESGSKVIIYLSNGETLDKAGHRKALYDWTQKNKGAVSFYSMIQKEDKKRGVLGYFSSVNKGKLFVSQIPSGFKRQIRKLMHSIRSPLAQNMEAYVYLMKEGADVSLYSPFKQLPNLYLDQPFVVMGTTKKLSPFTLFLQGKNKDHWFHVKKEISFQESKSTSPFLYEEWALQNAYRCYDVYLQDGNKAHLNSAKEFLTPYHLEEAFR